MILEKGFVPALGTPVDDSGKLMKESFCRQIDLMMDAGALGLLTMGSMGLQATLLSEECPKIAEAAVERAAGKIPVYAGAMDNSIVRAKARMRAMEDLPLEGFVFTTPYYGGVSLDEAYTYFREVAAGTAHKIFLYDLPGVTQTKINYGLVKKLLRDIPNFKGIKTADINMIRQFMCDPEMPEDFRVFFSGLDMFDVAYAYGVCTNLDGMFTVVPANAKKMYDALRAGDRKTGAECLTNIIALRDLMLSLDLMPAYSAGMNLLGCEGRYHMDYDKPYTPEMREEMRKEMIRIGELPA